MRALNAFGGAPLVGDSWVRVLYLDESGIGKISKDPILVVAGVIIHADTQWGPLQRKLDDLLSDMTPFGTKRPGCIHAKDIYHGSGEFPRDTWSQIRRNTLLQSVGDLVDEFRLPVPWMGIDRKEFASRHPDESPEDHVRDCYTVAAAGCFLQAELYMRQRDNSNEVCSCVLEENKQLQKRIPEVITALRDPEELAKCTFDAGWERVMPITKLIDHPAPQPKDASSILQLADYCAFSIKRLAEKKAGSRRLTGPLRGNLLRYKVPDYFPKAGRPPVLWNPMHIPSLWGDIRAKFEGGEFKLVAD